MIKVGEKELRNLPSELSIDEFEEISNILQDTQTWEEINSWRDIFLKMGADDMDLKKMTFKDFAAKAAEFNDVGETERGLASEFEIDGYTYRAYEGEGPFELMMADMGLVERIIKKRKPLELNYWAEVMAVIFKREDLTDAEHYTDAHINHKAKLFRENKIKADIAIPYIALITQELADVTTSVLTQKVDQIEGAEASEGLE